MTVVTVAQSKGGVGKSTITVNLATIIKKLGHSVIIIDADKQRSASAWAGYREEAGIKPTVPCVGREGNVRDTIKEMNKVYDYVLVDAAGRDSRELRTALTATHVCFIPFEASQFSLETLTKVNELIEDALDMNPNMLSLAFLNKVPSQVLNTEAAEAAEIIESCASSFKLLKTKIYQRKIYRSSIPEGRGVIECKNGKAKQEMHKLVWELASHIEERFQQ